jgi:hypothetical protein
MTTGSISFGHGYPTFGESTHKVWSGADGKYEIRGGVVALKRNFYSLQLSHQSVQIGNTTSPVGGNGSASLTRWTTSDELKLQSKLVKAIKTHDFNLAVNIAQGKMTLDLAVSNVRKIGRALIFLKHGRFAQAAEELGATRPPKSRKKQWDIGGKWLELQYGWLPLLSDTAAAAEAYASTQVSRQSIIKVSGKHQYPEEDFSNSPFLYDYPGTLVAHKRYVCELREQISTSRSLGLFDPLSVAWEIIPYSFVVDWFLPIGTYFENLAILPFLDASVMATTFVRYSARMGKVNFDPGPIHGEPPWYQGARRIEYAIALERVLLDSIPVQRPTFRSIPTALSPRRLFSAVALVHQRLRS